MSWRAEQTDRQTDRQTVTGQPREPPAAEAADGACCGRLNSQTDRQSQVSLESRQLLRPETERVVEG